MAHTVEGIYMERGKEPHLPRSISVRRIIRHKRVSLSKMYHSARSGEALSPISGRTCAFCATARANSSSGAGSSGVMLAPSVAPPYPTVLLRDLTGPPVEDGQLPIGFPPPMDSRFPEDREDIH